MTPFASTVLFRRGVDTLFRPPRLERPSDVTQARKAAARYWHGNLKPGDTIIRVIVAREIAGKMEISERQPGRSPWTTREVPPSEASKDPHIHALMAELGIDPAAVPPPIPDVLVINGFTYRRDI